MAEEKPAPEVKTDTADEPVVINETGTEEPAPEPTPPGDPATAGNRWSRFKHWYRTKKKLSIPLTILALFLLLMLIPPTRYALAGTVIKKNYSVSVLDSVTNTPVSGATVSADGVSAETGGDGKANLRLSVGKHALSVTKKYYADQNYSVTVPLLSQKNTPEVAFQATGRQVKVIVNNTFTRQPLPEATIRFAETEAKTDNNGEAIGIVPQSTKSEKVTISLEGYNDNEVTVQASDTEIKTNKFKLTPAGKIYFLSKLSGKIDVVKTDLDGKNRKTVVTGTGNEQERNTVLLASRDWKYLALLAKHEGEHPKLHLIETATDTLSTIDEGKAEFTPVGWDDDNFVYMVEREDHPRWQAGRSSIKSFNATTKRITLLDNTAAVGANNSRYAHESYSYGAGDFYIIDHNLVFAKRWDWGQYKLLKGKTNGIYRINVNGGGKQTLKTFAVDDYLNSFLYQPRVIYFQVDYEDSKYYTYANGVLTDNPAIKDAYRKYEDTYVTNTYLLNPSGDGVFWYEERDGKNTLLLGDIDAEAEKAVGRTSGYTPYGWYSDDYLLLAQDASELYILPKEGISKKIKPYKISDYHKPATSFYGYGGGYGGL